MPIVDALLWDAPVLVITFGHLGVHPRCGILLCWSVRMRIIYIYIYIRLHRNRVLISNQFFFFTSTLIENLSNNCRLAGSKSTINAIYLLFFYEDCSLDCVLCEDDDRRLSIVAWLWGVNRQDATSFDTLHLRRPRKGRIARRVL